VLSDQPRFAQIATKIATKVGRIAALASQAAENALASVRAEGLDPGVAESLLRRWARGELSDAQLDDAARQISTGELPAPPRA
jgi:Antitoxin VbhA